GAVGTAVYLAISGMTPQVSPMPAVASAVPVDAAAVPLAIGDAAAPATPPIETAAVVAAPPQKVQVELRVKSQPSGADVIRAADCVPIGKTPSARAFDRIDGEIELIVKLSGYKDTRVVLSTAKDG